MIEWLQKWYIERCDGDWEHEYGVAIGTIDNPGWSLKIDLVNTHLESTVLSHFLWEKDDDNWIAYAIKDEFLTVLAIQHD